MTDNSQARLSIVAYRPNPGKDVELMALTREHVPYLRSLGFATGRPHVIATAAEGTVIEVFEWVEGALEKAHQHARPAATLDALLRRVRLCSTEHAGGMRPDVRELHCGELTQPNCIELGSDLSVPGAPSPLKVSKYSMQIL